MKNRELVSVCIISYNSENTIIETLESICRQTYPQIELIISDDGSLDGTLEICEKWIHSKKLQFKNVLLLKSEQNTGIPANCNRAVKRAEGLWIKIIAADDILIDSAISDYMEYVCENPKIEVLFARMQSFEFKEKQNKYYYYPLDLTGEIFFDMTVKKQAMEVLLHPISGAPSVFLKKKVFDKYGYYEEKYRLMEDWPYWVKLTQQYCQLYLMKKTTVYWRIGHKSQSEYIYSTFDLETLSDFKTDIIYQLMPWYRVDYWVTELIVLLKKYIILHFFHNRKTSLSSKVYNIISLFEFRCMAARFKQYLSKSLQCI